MKNPLYFFIFWVVMIAAFLAIDFAQIEIVLKLFLCLILTIIIFAVDQIDI